MGFLLVSTDETRTNFMFGVCRPVYTRVRAQRHRIRYLYTYEQALPRYFGSLAESVVPFAKPSCRGRRRRRCHSRFSLSTLQKRSGDSTAITFRPPPFSAISVSRISLAPTDRPTILFVPTNCRHRRLHHDVSETIRR